MLEVRGDERLPPLPAVFSNFVQVARVATEIQFDFLFVDLNSVASTIEKAKQSPQQESAQLYGTPIAKVVVPALSLMQIREHMNHIFDAIEKELGKLPDAKETQHGDNSAITL